MSLFLWWGCECWLHGVLFFSSKLTGIKPFGKVIWPSRDSPIVMKYWWLVLMSEANRSVEPKEGSVTRFILKEEKKLLVLFIWLRNVLNKPWAPPRENAVKTWKIVIMQRSHESQAWALLIIVRLSTLANFAHALCNSFFITHSCCLTPTQKFCRACGCHSIKQNNKIRKAANWEDPQSGWNKLLTYCPAFRNHLPRWMCHRHSVERIGVESLLAAMEKEALCIRSNSVWAAESGEGSVWGVRNTVIFWLIFIHGIDQVGHRPLW